MELSRKSIIFPFIICFLHAHFFMDSLFHRGESSTYLACGNSRQADSCFRPTCFHVLFCPPVCSSSLVQFGPKSFLSSEGGGGGTAQSIHIFPLVPLRPYVRLWCRVLSSSSLSQSATPMGIFLLVHSTEKRAMLPFDKSHYSPCPFACCIHTSARSQRTLSALSHRSIFFRWFISACPSGAPSA